MNYLTEKHQQLEESQQSGLMAWFGQLPMDKKAVAIGLSLTVGIGTAAMAWKGESSERIYFCLKTPQKRLTCEENGTKKSSKLYRISATDFKAIKQCGDEAGDCS
jgi:hypothetical protein